MKNLEERKKLLTHYILEYEVELGRTPKRDEFLKEYKITRSELEKLFGNWTNFIRSLGLEVPQGKTDEELKKQLDKLVEELGRLPTL